MNRAKQICESKKLKDELNHIHTALQHGHAWLLFRGGHGLYVYGWKHKDKNVRYGLLKCSCVLVILPSCYGGWNEIFHNTYDVNK